MRLGIAAWTVARRAGWLRQGCVFGSHRPGHVAAMRHTSDDVNDVVDGCWSALGSSRRLGFGYICMYSVGKKTALQFISMK
jgi:hypothetical protein